MRTKPFIPVALCLLAAAPASAQADPAAYPAVIPAGKVVLPEKTEVKLSLNKDLKSGADKAGEVVPYEVERDVFSPFPAHVLLIPAGTPAFGKVTRSNRRGMLGRGGKLEFTCDYVRGLDGTKIALRAEPSKEKGRNNSGTSVAVAALVFAPMLLMSGRDVEVHKGQEITAFIDQDVLLADPKAARAADASPAYLPPPAPVAPPPAPAAAPVALAPVTKTLFTLTDGTQIVGSLVSADAQDYTVATVAGTQSVPIVSVKSMQALPAASSPQPAPAAVPPVAPVVAPIPPAPAAHPVPRLPEIKTFPQRVRLETASGDSYFASVTAFDGASYTVVTPSGTLTIKQADVKTLEILNN